MGSQMVDMQTIINDVTNQQTTFVNFENPVVVYGEFYVGVVLPTAAGDTIAVLTNTDGDTDPATAWEQWSDDTWFAYDNAMSWGYKMSHAIFPIVVPGDYLVADFSASPLTINTDETVQFSDNSFGSPDSWEWTFEGGNPATSNLQNPTVTYSESGLYDVSLTITKEGETNTKMRSEYIKVIAGNDTLNYPLPGSYTVYVLTDGGGYVSGNNSYGDKAVANKFSLSENGYLNGILYDFAVAVGANPDIEVNLYNSNSEGAPGAKLASKTVSLNTIKDDVANEQLTYVPFNPPVSVGQNFFAGFVFPTAAGDTLVVWGNSDGDTNPGTAWTLFSDNTWLEFSDPTNWALNNALAIHPIVQYTLGVNEQTRIEGLTVYPNPASNEVYLTWQEQIQNPVFRLMTMNGQLIHEMKQQGSASVVRFDISELEAGIYVLQMITDKGISTQKFVKD